MVMSDALTIGEVANRSGVATSALRFYEDQGLIASERTDSGHRRYPRAVIRRVASEVREVIGLGVQVGLVIGGGNIFRGAGLAEAGMDRVTADRRPP